MHSNDAVAFLHELRYIQYFEFLIILTKQLTIIAVINFISVTIVTGTRDYFDATASNWNTSAHSAP